MKISYRQLSIVVFMSFIALKLLSLPSFLYIESKNSAWLVALVLMLIDALYTFILVGLMKKNNCRNINEFMEKTLGKFLTKIILALLLVKFAFTVANISKGLEFFVIENFYNDFSWSLFIFPLVILCGFMIYKGIRNISRVFEMFVWAILIGCIYIAVKSVPGVDPYIYMPFLKDGITPLLSSAYTYIMWFGSSTFLIMLFGKVDFKDEKKSKMIIYIVLAIALVQFMFFVFYGLFDVTNPTHTFAVSDISQFSSGRSSIDELSWLVVSLWVVAQALQIALYGYCLMLTIMYLFNIKNKVVPVIIIDIYLILWSYLGANTINLERIFFSDFVSITSIITQYLIPLLLWLGYAVYSYKEKKKGAKYERKIKTHI
ncbi:MAG: GerAB/ArcD/ProY family transporter [Clostridia bacterium]|nr:GerAB/ArcD/ProY family transporter [Clostridia bacterium]